MYYSIKVLLFICAIFAMKSLKIRSSYGIIPRLSRTLRCQSSNTHITNDNNGHNDKKNDGTMISGLNGPQDVSVKVISLRNIVQASINKLGLSAFSATALGETMAGTLLMAAGLKGEETVQVNFVGDSGMKNIIVIADSSLNVRGRVGVLKFAPEWTHDQFKFLPTEFLGEGQVQVIRNHPVWKSPMNGIVQMTNASIATNLALYLAQSEQRTCAMLCDVKVHDGVCHHALAKLVDRLPGANEQHVECAIINLETVQQKGLANYLPHPNNHGGAAVFDKTSEQAILHQILDDCLFTMEKDSIRWEKDAHFQCTCSKLKVANALEMLGVDDLQQIVESNTGVEVRSHQSIRVSFYLLP